MALKKIKNEEEEQDNEGNCFLNQLGRKKCQYFLVLVNEQGV